jgi:catechol 2,3-dioxygenase-like lactoylglutathione lyase family enzyme
MDGEPDITSPMMRFLAVGDVAGSSAFYRDVLGFEVKEEAGGTEAILGPARIRFGKGGDAPGPAVLFLQTDDIAAKRSAIHLRGGAPSEIEKVNWIKMRMFEVRDPDGNVLWFGQSFHEEQDSPSRRGSQPRGLRQALPELPFDNVPAAVTYYCDVLGFRINYRQDDLGVLDRDAITVLLRSRTEQHKGIGSFAVYVDDADAHYAELSAKGARIQGSPVSHPWGLRDFSVLDPEGNRITFAQTFE